MSTSSVPARVTSAGESEPTDPAVATPMVQGARALVYLDRLPWIPALGEALASIGVEVRVATSFQELSAWLLCWRDRTALLLQPPAIDTFRRAVLESIRRLAPALPIVALIPARTAEVEQDLANARVASIIAADAATHEVIGEVTRVLRFGVPAEPTEEPSSDGDAP